MNRVIPFLLTLLAASSAPGGEIVLDPSATYGAKYHLAVPMRAPQVREVVLTANGLHLLWSDGPATQTAVAVTSFGREMLQAKTTRIPEGDIYGLAADDKGNLWVHQYDRARKKGLLLRCSADRGSCAPEATLPNPKLPRLLAWHGGRLVAVLREGTVMAYRAHSAQAEGWLRIERLRDPRIHPMKDGRFAAIDQYTGTFQVLPQDSSAPAEISLRTQALQKALNANAAAGLPESNRHHGGPITVFATALSEDGKAYLALSPFNRGEGAQIVEVRIADGSVREFRGRLHRTPDGEWASPVRIAVRGNRLYLVSWNGEIAVYEL
ncbi:MAG: hypothetical protein JNL98_23600 [Bryobacterales bacterium]|nr:hypothetical protein [Bryobacterales bacterium]